MSDPTYLFVIFPNQHFTLILFQILLFSSMICFTNCIDIIFSFTDEFDELSTKLSIEHAKNRYNGRIEIICQNCCDQVQRIKDKKQNRR